MKQHMHCEECQSDSSLEVPFLDRDARGTCEKCGGLTRMARNDDRILLVRTLEDVPAGKGGEMVAETLVLFRDLAEEDNLEVDWGTLKVASSIGDGIPTRRPTTHVVAVQAGRRPPAPSFDSFGQWTKMDGQTVANGQSFSWSTSTILTVDPA